jgi:Domain of unknown function (DUF4412)
MKKITLVIMLIVAMAAQVSAQGVYMEYKITSSHEGMTGSSKTYSQDGNTRSEFTMASPNMPAGFSRVTLMLKSDPKKGYMLNEKLKSYLEIDMSSSIAKESDQSQYEVIVVGKENVNGYNCTHIQIKMKDPKLDQDMWLSTEVLNYRSFESAKSMYTTSGLYKAFAAKGVAGFPVRIKAVQSGDNVQIDLVKAEVRKCDVSLFSLAGYKKEEAAPAGSAPADLQEMAKKLQSMTPEERQKMIEKLREKAGAPK